MAEEQARLSARSIGGVANTSIVAAEENQWRSSVPKKTVDLANDDVVITAIVNLIGRAFEYGQAARQNRNADIGVVEIHAIEHGVV